MAKLCLLLCLALGAILSAYGWDKTYPSELDALEVTELHAPPLVL